MLDGIWRVNKDDGTNLGIFETRLGNGVLMIHDKSIAKKITIGQIFHIYETHSKKKWKVEVTGHYRGHANEFTIKKLSDL